MALAVFAGTMWLHWPSVRGGFLSRMDDDEYLHQSIRWNGLTWGAVKWAFTTTEPYYHPLPRLSHVVDYQIWGRNAAGHHATSVVLHALNAALVFGFLWTLLGATRLGDGERLALALGVSLVFAAHPLQVETVSWISARSQLLSTAFGIGCAWAYCARRSRWTVWALFAAAILSKPTAVSFLFVILAIDYFPLRRLERIGWKRVLGEKVVMIAIAAAISTVTILTESSTGGMIEPLQAVHSLQRVYLTVQSLTFYPWKLVWPTGLSPYYPLGVGFSLQPMWVTVSALAVAGVTIASIWYRKRAPAVVAGWGAYVMMVLPVSGLVQRGWQAAADRYAYAAALPLLLLAGGAIIWLWRRAAIKGRAVLVCVLTGELAFLGTCTRARTLVWRNDETLWRSVQAQYPNSVQASEMLAQTMLNEGRVVEGIDYARRAVDFAPEMAETHMNLGIALTRANRIPEAIEELDRALEIKPDLAAAHHNLALALLQQGRVPEATAHWEQAVKLKPDYAEALCHLGIVLEKSGRFDEAAGRFEQALHIRPDYAEAHYNLGVTLVRVGRVAEAMAEWEEALRLQPDSAEAHTNLGVALEQAGKLEEARAHYEEALRIEPDLIQARYNLGVVLSRLGRVPEAIEQYELVLKEQPDFMPARAALLRLRTSHPSD
ncbi:MAG TPA: tetratricopeptide repeat protein [Verrucomicrobiae bacterium]|nr:tetratricopeptide repeat protein [Verrucomicrobiae bacterium]